MAGSFRLEAALKPRPGSPDYTAGRPAVRWTLRPSESPLELVAAVLAAVGPARLLAHGDVLRPSHGQGLLVPADHSEAVHRGERVGVVRGKRPRRAVARLAHAVAGVVIETIDLGRPLHELLR